MRKRSGGPDEKELTAVIVAMMNLLAALVTLLAAVVNTLSK